MMSGENLTVPVKIIGTCWPFGRWTLDWVLGRMMDSKRRGLQIMWSVAPVSRIHENLFWGEDVVWQEKVIPDVETFLAVLLILELEMLFARVNRFCICSWEKAMLWVSRFGSKTVVLCAEGILWKFLLVCGMVANLFPLGPFHPGGYPII